MTPSAGPRGAGGGAGRGAGGHGGPPVHIRAAVGGGGGARRRATTLRRVGAWGVDAVPGVAAAWGVAVWSGQGGRWLTTLPGLGWVESVAVRLSGDPWSVVWSLVALAVPYIFVASMIEGLGRQTLGRWIFRIEVVDADGEPASRLTRAIRATFQLLIPLSLGMSALWSLVGREGRAWHDILSSTWVVNKITRQNR